MIKATPGTRDHRTPPAKESTAKESTAEEGTAIMIDASRGQDHAGPTTTTTAGDIVRRWARQNPRSAALHARARRLLPGA